MLQVKNKIGGGQKLYRKMCRINVRLGQQSFCTKKDRSLELISVFHKCAPGRRKLAGKVVGIFGNDTMTIVEVNAGGKNR